MLKGIGRNQRRIGGSRAHEQLHQYSAAVAVLPEKLLSERWERIRLWKFVGPNPAMYDVPAFQRSSKCVDT
jgi:hypothetical protein